jgi:hypothetical protein
MQALGVDKRYSSYSFSTSALIGVSGQRYAPGKGRPVPVVREAGWAPEPVWTQIPEEKSFRLCRALRTTETIYILDIFTEVKMLIAFFWDDTALCLVGVGGYQRFEAAYRPIFTKLLSSI